MLTEQHQTMLKMLKDVKITKYVTHASTVANDGVLMQPKLVNKVVDKDGNKMEIKFYPKNKVI